MIEESGGEKDTKIRDTPTSKEDIVSRRSTLLTKQQRNDEVCSGRMVSFKYRIV